MAALIVDPIWRAGGITLTCIVIAVVEAASLVFAVIVYRNTTKHGSQAAQPPQQLGEPSDDSVVAQVDAAGAGGEPIVIELVGVDKGADHVGDVQGAHQVAPVLFPGAAHTTDAEVKTV